MSTFTMPLRLAYIGASTIEDAAGETVAECPDNATATAIVGLMNAAHNAVWAEKAFLNNTDPNRLNPLLVDCQRTIDALLAAWNKTAQEN